VLRLHPLRHGTQVRGAALAIENLRRHSAVPVGSHDRMHRRMHDDIHTFCQELNLIGGRVRARLRQHVVGRVAPDHHAAGGRIHAIGGVAGDVGGSDRVASQRRRVSRTNDPVSSSVAPTPQGKGFASDETCFLAYETRLKQSACIVLPGSVLTKSLPGHSPRAAAWARTS
jgi:hypothetical protein